MAIIFTKGLATDKLLNAYNNNVVRFYQDDVARTALKCIIEFDGNEFIIYPGPNGNFYYNFMSLVTSIINTNNFNDDIVLGINDFIQWTEKVYKNSNINFTIILDDLTPVSTSINTHWLISFTQIDDYKYKSIPHSKNVNEIVMLHPQKNLNDNKLKIFMWNGYPFDLTIYTGGNYVSFYNTDTNYGINYDSYTLGEVVRFIVSRGTFNYQDLELSFGINNFLISDTINLEFEYINPTCKQVHYLKWMNQYGGWSYWLFDRGKKSKSIKNIGDVNNDFSNVEDTTSPTINIGKNSDPFLSLEYSSSSEDENLILDDLFESNKIYMFTGIPGKLSFNDFIEVSIKGSTIVMQNIKRDNIKYEFDIELPKRVTRTS